MSQIITELTGVPSTMLLTLKGRANEQLHRHPLFQDPLAVEWSKLLPWDSGLEAIYSKSKLTQISFAVRAYHHDQIASRHIANHSNPVVVELGAGLSTRFHRIGESSYRWLEIDLPVVTEIRCQLDTQTQQHQFISASVMDFDWMNAVPDVSPEKILFIAEGLLPYFEANEVQRLVSQMRSRFPGASFVLDILGNYGKVGSKVFSQIGAPHKWYVNNEQEVTAMGLRLLNVQSLYQLYPERWPWLPRLLLKLLTQLSYFRNGYLILETKL
ncbi:class I SAM-dependent methyltransferase [Aetokthonos hydrillicola Thurmond2011]|jgi:O-methyltransferase involved in polyketide biosynthesis|uniref:Class I SAM-dependent methyltransferase n=1 Tax=Aetokthonos hydrillicola Thurmond2011 TaxID=2712845 RepID=A0AAP5M998_9CYAN|nr:class I SAM-dependent methyltransferase [Aetokthonos hydrillicola]MBO3463554.1 class I SAM-dependent methyltransferase [Aetokthonos hydrillicola CCALA 1050]MBW4583788.1 class I SAM-dependent methyltransferase [Aetokthonos hydrillicola CCALA 1050]MDR9895517.1 class I SAM-dependent methyltransferase [Aetokthonos hydrillicola Thurmond2011]